MLFVTLDDRYGTRTFSFAADDILVGRDPQADLVLDSKSVLPTHIRVVARDGRPWVEDVRGKVAPRAVTPTDKIVVGGIILRVAIDDLTPELVDSDGGDDGGDDAVERRFLDAIRAAPADPDTRAVYADWLEGRGHDARAEFLRAQLAVGTATSSDDPAFVAAAARLAALAPDVGTGWRARVAMVFVEGCFDRSPWRKDPEMVALELRCPKRWDRMTATEHDGVRHCDGCQRNVTYCTTIEHARTVATAGGCVAIDIRTPRDRYDLQDRTRMMVGQPSPEIARYGRRKSETLAE